MVFRAMLISALLITLLLLAACTSPQDAPTEGARPTSFPTSTPVQGVTPTPSPASTLPPAPTPTPTLAPTPEFQYLTEEIPPCTPIQGSSVDPCEPDARIETGVGGMASGPVLDDEPLAVRYFLDGSSIGFIPHIVIRGTYIPDTVRCTPGNPNRDPSYEEPGGLFHSSVLLACYADVRVNAYILGSGPPRLTVQVHFHHYWEGEYREPAVERGMTLEELLEWASWAFEIILEEGPERTGEGIYGREVVLFIGPPHSQTTEVWEVFSTWDVQRMDDDTVVAIHPLKDFWRYRRPDDYQTHRSKLEMELPAFTQAVTAAHQARVTEYGGRIAPADIASRATGVELPMLVTDANQLRQFLTDTGAYSHPDGPPAQPPPIYVCNSDTAVSDPRSNRHLVHDCEALLAAKDTLRGTASLDWSTGDSIGDWEGISTGDSTGDIPTRVTKVELPNKNLSGSIPAELGDLYKLTHLDLSNNSLTGEIPEKLGLLQNLTSIKLSGNSITGCIPVGLEDVATNDLSSLNLLYCRPPAPGNFTAIATGDTSMALSWDAVSNTSKYRVEYISRGDADWNLDDDTLTDTTHTVDGLTCGREYAFRVSAYGSGTTYAAEWSDGGLAAIRRANTEECPPPVFSAPSYSFTIADDAEIGVVVGMVSATHPAGEAVSYEVIGGNGYDKFAIGASTGDITVSGALDYRADSSYTLKVEARAEGRGWARVTVSISVTPRRSDSRVNPSRAAYPRP